MSKKEILSRILNAIGLIDILHTIRGLFIKEVRILAYHRVCDSEDNHFNDPGLVIASIKQFEQQVIYLKNKFNPVSFLDLKNYMENGISLPKNPLIITFDDGFLDNYRNAYKILKNHSVPATMFISTDYMDQDQTFWFNNLYNRVVRSPGIQLDLDLISTSIKISESFEIRENQAIDIVNALKHVSNTDRLTVLNDINKVLLPYEQDELAKPLSWDNVVEMDESIIEIGSHTSSHPVLSMLTLDELKHELSNSKSVIEEKLNNAVTVIAYPVGGSFAFNKQVLSEVDSAGYYFGASYVAGSNYLNNMQILTLKRLHVESYVNFNMFKSMLTLPEIFND